MARSFACLVLGRNLYLVLDRKIDRPTVLVDLDLLLLLCFCHRDLVPFPDLVDPFDLIVCVLMGLTDVF